MDNKEEMVETEQEHRYCIICRKIYQLINLPITIVNNKILFDNCLRLFKIEEGSYPDAYKWKWDAKYDLPNFCNDCGEEISILAQLEEDLNLTTKKIDELIKQTKTTILKTTSLEKLESSRKSPILFAFEYSHCTQVIDYFRSVAIHDLNPSVLISSLDQTITEIKELKFDKSILTLSQEDIDEYMIRFGDKFKCKVCSAVIKERRNFTRHINVLHKDIRRFECTFCHLQHYERSEISCHIQKTHRRIKDPGWLSHVTILENGQLSLTDDERELYWLDLGDSYQCKVCSVIIKDERNVSRHVNQVHKALKRYQCNLCFESFYAQSDCHLHLCQNHNISLRDNRTPFSFVEQKSEVLMEQSKLKCLLCYQCLEESGVQISSEVFETLCSLLTVVILENIFGNLQQKLPILCAQCFSLATELHNLYFYRENNQFHRQIQKIIFKLKTAVLLSLSSNFYDTQLIPGETSIAEKAEYLRRQIVQDFSPVVSLVKLQEHTYSSSTASRCVPRPPQARFLAENSIMKLVADDEIININPELGDKLKSLSDEEFQYYFTIEEGKYTCRICSSLCTTHRGAVEHCNKLHKKAERYQCKYCDKKFYLKSYCANHIVTDSTHKRERAHVADGIEKKIMASQSLERTTPDGIIELPMQRQANVPPGSIIKVGNKHKCAICSLTHKNRSSAMKHQKITHLGLDRYKCEFCDFKNYHRFPAVLHVQRAHPEKMIGSDHGSRSNMLKNISKRTASGRKVYSSDSALLLGIHKLKEQVLPKAEDHYTVEGVNFVCNFCGRKFNRRYSFISHLEEVHFAIRRYQCTACGRKFHRLGRCKKHLRMKHMDYFLGLKNGTVELKCIRQTSEEHSKVKQEVIPMWENVSHHEETCVQSCDSFSNQELPFIIEEKHSVMLDDSRDIFADSERKPPMLTQEEFPIQVMEASRIEIQEETSSLMNKDSPMEIKDEYCDSNGEELAVRLPVEGELEISVNAMTILEDEDQFFMENNVTPEDGNKKNGYSGNSSTDLFGNECTIKPIIVPRTKNANKVSKKSPGMAKMDKCYIYTLLKPGDIIELPKNPRLKQEEKNSYKRTPRGFKCLKCDKILKTRIVFRQHFGNVHDDTGGFQCSVCAKRFYFKFPCAVHFVCKHTNLKPYLCHLCEKSFLDKGTMVRHVARHTGHRPFTCSECGLKFVTERVLAKHHKNVHLILS